MTFHCVAVLLLCHQVAELLSYPDEQVFLVDIRSDATREQDGLPELKLSARFKVAAFPLQAGLVPKRIAREAVNADELNLMINAAYITGECVRLQ